MTHRVLWKEGTFILPQHFQQQERFLLNELQHRIAHVQSYWWGFSKLIIAEAELGFGQFSLEKCDCQFQDGTVLNAPQENRLPSALKLEDGVTDAIVYLVLPNRITNTNELNTEDENNSVGRFTAHSVAVSDNTSSDAALSNIEVGDVCSTLMVETEDAPIPDGYMKLAVARVKEVISGRIVLDDDFIGNVLNTQASYRITRFLRELAGMLSARGDSLAERATDTGSTSGVTEYADFLLLQLINRLEPWLAQTLTLQTMHPYPLYTALVSVAGELSTFMKRNRRPAKSPLYKHDNLTECFNFIFDDIETSFTVVLEQVATQIELSPPKNNIRAARLNHKSLLESGVLILAVSAKMPEESLRADFPAQTKIGPGEKIFQLVQSALPGIQINLLSHVPQEIPYHSGFCYYELSKQDSLWHELQQSKGLAIHVSGNFPELEMKLWAINRKQ
ncbi:type VI secretion system baseplate subunit TssK [Ningiella sp. W23]|uniref:type VI secretion system baseplate subunit TssK n=1 Tax=Ningiella sp. W23 TaxID=3023715 RepID=UPI003757660B